MANDQPDTQLSDEDFAKQYQSDATPAVSDEDFINQHQSDASQAPQASAAPGMSDEDFANQSWEDATKSSRTGAFARGAAEGILPSIAAIPGAAAGAALGFASPIPGGALIGGLVGAVLAGGAAGYVQDKALEATGAREGSGFLSREQQQADVEEHPYYRTAGNLASALVPFGGAASEAAQLAGGAVKTLSKTAQRVGGATIFGGLEAGQELVTEGKIDPGNVALAAGTGALAPNARPWTKPLAEAGETYGQAVAKKLKAVAGRPNPASGPGTAAEYAKPATGPDDRVGPVDESKPKPAPTTPDAGGSTPLSTDAIDPTIAAAMGKAGAGTTKPVDAPTQTGEKLDAQFPKVKAPGRVDPLTDPSRGPIEAAPPETAPYKGPEQRASTRPSNDEYMRQQSQQERAAETTPQQGNGLGGADRVPDVPATPVTERAAQPATPPEPAEARTPGGGTVRQSPDNARIQADDEAWIASQQKPPAVPADIQAMVERNRVATPGYAMNVDAKKMNAATRAPVEQNATDYVATSRAKEAPVSAKVIGTTVQALVKKGDEASLSLAKQILEAPEADQGRLATLAARGLANPNKTIRGTKVATVRIPASTKNKEIVGTDRGDGTPYTAKDTKIAALRSKAIASAKQAFEEPANKAVEGETDAETKARAQRLMDRAKEINGGISPLDAYPMNKLNKPREWSLLREARKLTTGWTKPDEGVDRIINTPEGVFRNNEMLHQTPEAYKDFESDNRTSAQKYMDDKHKRTGDTEKAEAAAARESIGRPEDIAGEEDARMGQPDEEPTHEATAIDEQMGEPDEAQYAELPEPPKGGPSAKEIVAAENAKREANTVRLKALKVWSRMTEAERAEKPELKPEQPPEQQGMARKIIERDAKGRITKSEPVNPKADEAILAEAEKVAEPESGAHAKAAEAIAASKAPRVEPMTLRRLFNQLAAPDQVSDKSRSMASLINEKRGLNDQQYNIWLDKAEPFRKTVNEAPIHVQVDVQKGVDTGKMERIRPDLRPLAEIMRASNVDDMNDLKKLSDMEKQKWVEEHFAHFWKNEDAAKNFAGAWVKQGSAGSLHERGVPTISEGLAKGLELKYNDPIEVNSQYKRSIRSLIESKQITDHMVKVGDAKWFDKKTAGASGNPDSSVIPPGWTALRGREGPGTGGGGLYAPDDMAHVYNNYITKAFPGSEAWGTLMNGAQKISNAWTSVVLGMNGFHFATEVNEGFASEIVKSIGLAAGGHFKEAAITAAKSPAAGYFDYKLGKNKTTPEYLKPGSSDARTIRIVNALTKAGAGMVGSAHDPSMQYSKRGSLATAYFRSALTGQLADAKARIAEGTGYDINSKGMKATSEIMDGLGRILSTVADPLFNHYIPDLKNGVNHSLVGAWLDKHPDATEEQLMKVVNRIVSQTDNAHGEMAYDRMFLNKSAKQALQIGMTSPSWTIGTLRAIAGGMKVLATHPSRLSINSMDYDPKAAYPIALALSASLVNAAYQFLSTGEPPKSGKDLVAGRTGGTTLSGKPERAILPGYEKDVLGWFDHPTQEALNKIAPGPRTVIDLVMNKDWRQLPIYKATDPASTKIKDAVEHVLGAMNPISLKNIFESQKKGSKVGLVGRALGARAAPTWLEDPERTNALRDKRVNRDWKIKTRADARDIASRVP